MSTYDLRTAFYNRIIALTYDSLTTLKPDEVFDATEVSDNYSVRRGTILNPVNTFESGGDGKYTRVDYDFQIDLWVPHSISSPLKRLDTLADGHIEHFFPVNGKGLTFTENGTSGHVTSRPTTTNFGREGAYLRAMVEGSFYTEHHPA